MKKTRKALLNSIISLVLCFSMLLGTTYAWFTDSATSAGNIIKSGVLDIEMYWTDDLASGQWNDNSQGSIFNYENWEPGYTDVKYIKIVNAGNLAFRYALGVAANGAVTKLADVIDVYCIQSPMANLTGRGDLPGTPVTNLTNALNGATIGSGTLEEKASEIILAIALKMKEDAGNEYQTLSLSANANGTPTTFSVCLMATQYTYESDSFDNQYDDAAPQPGMDWTSGNVETSASVTADENGIMTADATLSSGEVRATVPEGTKVDAGTDTLILTISKTVSSSDVTIGETEELLALDVHIEGIAPDNTKPVIVELGKVLPAGLNIGNLSLYHVENGETKIMTQVTNVSELDTHNEFYYDPATGNLTVAMATFSEVALVADTENAWNGETEAFSSGSGTENDPYIIANADQLAYMGDRVSNDNANYGSAYYKLIADVNIGGIENREHIFYPIGYTKVGGEVATADLNEIWFAPINSAKPGDKDGDVAATMAENSWYTYGGSFQGVFDGNGNKITGIYQNTWAMKGNYDGNYYNAAMGLFGYVNGGTVKNLTIDNFYSEGEFAPTGCVAAYAAGDATFENITITNSHPQTYNTGVAGIVGWDNGGDTQAKASNFTFKNITVDDSNTISALWGSWDVAAAGLLGYLGQYSKANFENCNVSATIDVYNDVCGNYQYYWYRYCGAFIGTVDKRLDNGKGALDLSNVTATNCTVNFGDRHEYYYCEFEKNTQASYTEDYQFSRVPHSELNMEANPVTCTHTHTANEDKQAVYIPFRQLFGGYGWGVDGVDLGEYENIQITEVTTSEKKFEAIINGETFVTGTVLTLGEIFKELKEVVDHRVQVFVSPVGDDSTVSAVYTPNTTDWTKGTLTFSGVGTAKIVITDYNYCLETTTPVTIKEPDTVEKFEAKENLNFVHTIEGDAINKTLGDIFSVIAGKEINEEGILVTFANDDGVEYVFEKNTEDWTASTLAFSGAGVVTITITDQNYCNVTTATVTISHPEPVDKFAAKDALKYTPKHDKETYSFKIGDLFALKSGISITTDVVVTVDGVEYQRTAQNWADLEITLSQYGTVTVTLTDNNYCKIASNTVTFNEPKTEAKFEYIGKETYYGGQSVKLSELFELKAGAALGNSVSITVVGGGEVGYELSPATDSWDNRTITFKATGSFTITIKEDSDYCTATTCTVNVTNRDKFEIKFPNNKTYCYRVGNSNSVAIGSLFKAKDGVEISNVTVSVTAQKGANVSGTYTAHDIDWTKGTIQFSGTGVVNVTISATGANSVELKLEVVNAVNATTATSAKSNNVVLLNDVGLHTVEVSNGYTLYGNGFKMTATSDVMYDAMNAGFVVLKNGTLDNVQIICPNFSYSIIYSNQIKSSENTAVPNDSSNDARGNVRSAVMVDGSSQIVNSYIHGGRAAIFLRSGNLVVDGSTISGGAAANIHTMSAQSLTLRNATLIQKPFKANVNDTSKTIMGFSGLFECDENGNATPVILEGTLIQDAWINESYKQYTPSAASSIITNALSKSDFIHDLDGDGTKESLNLGFTYIPQSTGGSTNANVTDNRTNKNAVPYAAVDVGSVLASAKVYSYKSTSGTSDDFTTEGTFTPSEQGTTAPTVSFTDTNADRVFETKFDTSDNRWESSLTVNLDNGNYTFSWDKFLVQKHGANLKYTVKTASSTAVDTSKTIALTASSVTDYILTITDTDGVTTHTAYFTLTATKKVIPNPELDTTTKYGDALLVVKSKDGDWTVGIPALEGIKIKYYDDSKGQEVILDLATLTPSSKGKQNGTNNYWEYNNGIKLKVTSGYIHDTKQIYGMPVVVDNNGTKQMYFTISSTNGYVSKNTTARAVTLSYEFTDTNGKTLKFSHTWNVTRADLATVAQYSYSDFVNGTMTDLLTSSSGGGSGCVTPDTLITLADGSQVRVDSLTGNEELLVWNMETGMLDSAPILFVDNDPESSYEIVHLYFSDGTDVKVIYEHGFWDYDLNKYVYLDENAADYIGHTFAKQNGDRLERVQLVDVVLENQITTAWSPVTEGHLCYFVNDMLSMPGGVGGLFNIFDVDVETMTYDYAAMAEDIEKYGLFTYEELNAIEPLSEEMFDAAGGAYLKISMGKGNLTMDELVTMIRRYSKFF